MNSTEDESGKGGWGLGLACLASRTMNKNEVNLIIPIRM